jgi:hypothetical protein
MKHFVALAVGLLAAFSPIVAAASVAGAAQPVAAAHGATPDGIALCC